MMARWIHAEGVLPILVLLGGVLIAGVAGVGRGQSSLARWTLRVACGAPLGFGVLSLLFFFSLFLGLPWVGMLWVGSGILLVVAWWNSHRGGSDVPALGNANWAFAVLLLVSLSTFLLVHRLNLVAPEGRGDGIGIWNTHARFLSRAGNEVGSLLRDKSFGAADYPLHWPAAVAAQWSLLGEEAGGVRQGTALIFLFGLAAMLLAAATTLSSSWWHGCLGAALLLATPQVWMCAQWQYADVPLALCLLAAAYGLCTLVGPERMALPPWITGFLIGLLPWTKNEGLVLAPLLVVIFLRPIWKRKAFLPLVLGAAAPILAVLMFKISWAPENFHLSHGTDDLWSRLADSGRWSTVAVGFWSEVDVRTGWGHWGLGFPIVLMLALCCGSWQRFLRPESILIGLVALSVAGLWFLALVATPRPVEWQTAHAVDRLLLQVFPVILLWLACFVAPRRVGTS